MKLHGEASTEQAKKVLLEFEDTIYQRPPLRASVKRQLRTRRVYYLSFLEREDRNILFRVGCEAGTYIRKLCFDIGEILGCGAHMQELRRTRSGPFVESKSAILHDVAYWFTQWQESKDEKILRGFVHPVEQALVLIPKMIVKDSAVDAVCHGAKLTARGVLSIDSGIEANSMVVVMTLKGEAVSLAKSLVSSEQILSMERGIVASTERVFMPRGTYPKSWKSGEETK